ncbi:MAG: glycosyltransferase family 2 protein [Actinomycetota bacterium]|nr:glycosyltransferase family 2 protein [Actinomycetota bacterium]MDQ5807508.1 glycosyltransferase family 2 protein [Actinomycetota bacterium]
MAPVLDIVIVSSTGAREVLRPCLRSLREHPLTIGDMRVHLVDNASTDGTPEMVRTEFPEVVLHALDWNSGFCVANNVVLRETQAELVLVLNPDTEVYDGVLDHMVRFMRSRPDVGMSTCRLEQPDGTLDHAAKRSFPTPLGALAHFVGIGRRARAPKWLAQYRAPELGEYDSGEVDAVNGAFMLVRQEALRDVGLLDEGYWLYMDDLDWCFRFRQKGWKVWYEGAVTTMHVKGGTTKRKRRLGLRHNVAFHRSMGRFYRKFYAGRNPALDAAIYVAILGKLGISVTRSAIARRSLV